MIKNAIYNAANQSKYFKRVIFEETMTSTQYKAKDIVSDIYESFIVSTLHQTRGVGRFNRDFESPKNKGFYGSFVFTQPFEQYKFSTFNLFIALAITKTIEPFIDATINIKWPNDIYIDGKKVCGFLSEVVKKDKQNIIICGIGINLFYAETSVSKKDVLENFTTEPIDVEQFILKLFKNIEKYYDLFLTDDFNAIRDDYFNYSMTIGENIKVTTQNEVFFGKAVDIDNYGILTVVDTNNNERKVISADIE